MGRLIILFSFTVIICSHQSFGQKYYVPDNIFRDYLISNYPFCMSGDSLITDSVILSPVSTINVQYLHIADLSGIEYFTTLDQLNCYSNELTALPSLPPSLQALFCFSNQLTELPPLPANLKFMGCGDNNLSILPDLPSSLQVLNCGNNLLDSLPPLPAALTSLTCLNNSITEFPPLPSNLISINCYSNGIHSLPTLPSGLQKLRCGNNYLDSLPNPLPSGLTELECEFNTIDTLPTLPSGLQLLYCGGNNIDSLPNPLPSGLTELKCNVNDISVLPPLPSGLMLLEFTHNNISSIPLIPAGLTRLDCSFNKLDFADIVPVMTVPSLGYAPQDSIEISLKDTLDVGNNFSAVANTNADPYNIYQWFKNDIALSADPRFSGITSDTLVIYPLQLADTGSYYCKITNSLVPGLTLYRRTISLYVNNVITGLPSTASFTVDPAVYPNPATEVLHVNNPLDHVVHVRIMDLEGRLILKAKVSPNNTESIETGACRRGFYFLFIEGETVNFCKKIILQ
jgi:Leucine-rich repeat (LRR) protein